MVPIGIEIPWPEWQTFILKATGLHLEPSNTGEFIMTGQAIASQSQARLVKIHSDFVFEGPKCGLFLPLTELPSKAKSTTVAFA